jgi:phosphatidylserine decarboxylase
MDPTQKALTERKSLPEGVKKVNAPVHREGWRFIAIAAGVNLLAAVLSPWAGLAFVPLTLWCIAFFRDPERETPAGPGLVISPADGKLLPIVEVSPPEELGLGPKPRPRLSIFMDVFNVHVNRIPEGGTVTALAYRPGKFFNARFDKASVHNERLGIRLTLEDGAGKPSRELGVVQIAGLVARRIHCEVKEGQRVCRGDRFGIIRFGSRVDVYLPEGARVRVHAGQKVRAGETVLADFPP